MSKLERKIEKLEDRIYQLEIQKEVERLEEYCRKLLKLSKEEYFPFTISFRKIKCLYDSGYNIECEYLDLNKNKPIELSVFDYHAKSWEEILDFIKLTAREKVEAFLYRTSKYKEERKNDTKK